MKLRLTRKDWKNVQNRAAAFADDIDKFMKVAPPGEEVTLTLAAPYADFSEAVTLNDWVQPSLFTVTDKE